MAKCKITNRWANEISTAGLGISSPRGGHVFIHKLDIDLISDIQWNLIDRCLKCVDTEIELSKEEMTELALAAKSSNGVVAVGKRKNVAAPQNNKVPQQSSYAQRNAERLNRIASTNQSTLQGQCPNCSQRGMKVKHHGTWAGYYCMACSKGGSITLKK